MPHGHSRIGVPSASELPDRLRRVLITLTREYIEHGEPVSSLWLAAHGQLGLSSATVRNMLSRLEQEGYLHQPHTSAGRVPTDRAYRLYVDQLLDTRRRRKPATAVEEKLRRAQTVEDVLVNVSQELSRVSSHVGFAIAPAAELATLKRIDFVSLDADRVMVVWVSTAGQISQKVVQLAVPMTPDELLNASNYVNREFQSLSLTEIHGRVVQRLHEDRVLYDRLRARALELIRVSLEGLPDSTQISVHGTSTLLDDHVPVDVGVSLKALRALLGMIEEKHRLIQLLTEYIEGPGLTIVIGGEHASPELRNLSLVASTFFDGEGIGTIGVIGPTRMRYPRTIAAVDSVSALITRVLGGDPPSTEHD